MAIDPIQRAEAFASAQASIRAGGGPVNFTPGSTDRDRLITRLIADHGITGPQARQQVGTIISQAARAIYTAEHVENQPNTPLASSQLPIDPSIPSDADRYRYRVVVEFIDSAGNVAHDTMVIVNSNQPLSASQAHAQAIAIARGPEPDSPLPSRIAAAREQYTTQAFVVTAGRR